MLLKQINSEGLEISIEIKNDICKNIKKSSYNKQVSGLRYEKQIVKHIGTKLYECNILESVKNIEIKKEKKSNFFNKHKK
jgi:hypothetical protein